MCQTFALEFHVCHKCCQFYEDGVGKKAHNSKEDLRAVKTLAVEVFRPLGIQVQKDVVDNFSEYLKEWFARQPIANGALEKNSL
jgi:hypothetical protein